MDISMISLGPGTLYTAPDGTAVPATLTAGFAAPWVAAGLTVEGSKFAHTYNFEPVEVAEILEPVGLAITGRVGVVSFALVEMTATHLLWLLNGGSITTEADSSKTVVLPELAQLVPRMWGFMSEDLTEMHVWKRCYNTGGAETERRKGATKAAFPFEVMMVRPTDGSVPWVPRYHSSRA